MALKLNPISAGGTTNYSSTDYEYKEMNLDSSSLGYEEIDYSTANTREEILEILGPYIEYEYRNYHRKGNVSNLINILEDEERFNKFLGRLYRYDKANKEMCTQGYHELLELFKLYNITLSEDAMSRLEYLDKIYLDNKTNYLPNKEDVIAVLGDTIRYSYREESKSANVTGMLTVLLNEESFNRINGFCMGKPDYEKAGYIACYHELYNYLKQYNITLTDDAMKRLEKFESTYNKYKDNYKPLSNVEELSSLKKYMEDRLAQIEQEYSALKSEYDLCMTRVRNPVPFQQDKNDAALKRAEELRVLMEPLESEREMLAGYLHQVNQNLALAPYEDIRESNAYINYYKNFKLNETPMDFEKLALEYQGMPWMYAAAQSNGYYNEELTQEYEANFSSWKFAYYLLTEFKDLHPSYNIDAIGVGYGSEMYYLKYMTKEQAEMFIYLLDTNPAEATNYLNLLEDSINKTKGTIDAANFINSLDLNDKGKLEATLANYLGVSLKGLGDGIENFFSGLDRLFETNGVITAKDYETMIILQYLQENSNFYDEIYEFHSSLGNMIPAITASAIVSVLATPMAGEIVGSSLMGLSAAGNAKHQALINGNSLLSSTIYGIFVGTSEACLQYFLGGISGLSKEAGFTFKSLLSEGFEEYLQEWIDAGLQAVVLHENVDWSKVPEASMKSFFMGVLMSGFLNGGQNIVNVMINGVNYNVDVEATLKYLNEHPDAPIDMALEYSNPGLFSKLFGGKKGKYSYTTERNITNLIAKYNGDFNVAFTELLYTAYQSGTDYNVRQASRDIMTYLMKNKGFTAEQCVQTVINAGWSAINYRGYTSTVGKINNLNVRINEQVGIVYGPGSQMLNPNAVLSFISNLPAELQACVTTINFYDTFNPEDFYWEIQYNTKDFVSAATGGNGVINIYRYNGGDYTLLIHEIGHSYDTFYASLWNAETGKISTSKAWQDAMQADYLYSGEESVTNYGKNSPAEDFAETLQLYLTDPHALDAFPNRKALFEQYLPVTQQVTTTIMQTQQYSNGLIDDFHIVLDTMINKYGEVAALDMILDYMKTGNIRRITHDNNCRDIITRYSLDELSNYFFSQEIFTVNIGAAQLFDNVLSNLIQNCGQEQAIICMQKYLETGDISFITQYDTSGYSLSQYSLSEFKNYLKSINHGSINVRLFVTGSY